MPGGLEAFKAYGSLFQRQEESEEERRLREIEQKQRDQRLELDKQKAGIYDEYIRAQMENMAASRERQAQQQVWSNAEQIFKTTGDPNQALRHLNQNLGTDYEFMGAKDDWVLFGSPNMGQHAWNWRTGESQTLVPPRPRSPEKRVYNKGSQEFTEFVDPDTGRVVKSSKAPRWKPEAPEGKEPPGVMDLIRAYNSNLKGIASEVGAYLRPEQRREIESMPEDSPLLAQVLAQGVQESALPSDVKAEVINRIRAVNQAFLPKINETVGVKMPEVKNEPVGERGMDYSPRAYGKEEEPEKNKGKVVVRTGITKDGRRVIQYDDGSIEYAED